MNYEESLKIRNIILDLEAGRITFERSLVEDKVKVACKLIRSDVILAVALLDEMLHKHNEEHIEEKFEENIEKN